MYDGEVLTGCRATFSLGEKVVGYATGVTVREATQFEPVRVLGHFHVAEHAPLSYDVSMTADFVRIIGQSLKNDGIIPTQGNNAADHLASVIASAELTASITADASSEGAVTVMQVQGVRISEQNTSVTAQGVTGVNVSMVAKRAYAEADLPSD